MNLTVNANAQVLHLLHQAFQESRMRNPAYSLRAFAKKLRIPVSALSEIMNGKHRVTHRMGQRVLNALPVDPSEATQTLAGLSNRSAGPVPTEETKFTQIDMDQYHLIAEWYHFAILSLTETTGFQSRATWIAKRLGINTRTANAALIRLERMGLMVKDAHGRNSATGKSFATSSNIANPSLRRSHFTNLELARNSLENDSLEARDFSTMTMAIDPEKIPKAKGMIRDFRHKLCRFLESGDKSEVYKVCFQLFPLSRPTSTKRKSSHA